VQDVCAKYSNVSRRARPVGPALVGRADRGAVRRAPHPEEGRADELGVVEVGRAVELGAGEGSCIVELGGAEARSPKSALPVNRASVKSASAIRHFTRSNVEEQRPVEVELLAEAAGGPVVTEIDTFGAALLASLAAAAAEADDGDHDD